MEIKIIQITSQTYGSSDYINSRLCGLGEDNKIYFWNEITGSWYILIEK